MRGLFSTLTVAEVATRCKVHPQTVRRWIRQGKLHRIAARGERGRFLIRLDEVEDRLMALGLVRPRYRPGDLVIRDGQLAQVSTWRPSMGYLIYLGPGAYEWVPEASLSPARQSHPAT